MELKEYSDKSFCIFGENTKEYKEELKSIGGKWNSNLKYGPGWIFSNKNKVKVQEWLKKITICEHIYKEEQNVCTKCGIKLNTNNSPRLIFSNEKLLNTKNMSDELSAISYSR